MPELMPNRYVQTCTNDHAATPAKPFVREFPFTCVHPLTQTIYRDLQIVSTRLYEHNGKGIETMCTRE